MTTTANTMINLTLPRATVEKQRNFYTTYFVIDIICSLYYSDGRFATNENDSIRLDSVSQTIRLDSVQPTSRYLINSLIFVKPVNDNVYVSISHVCLQTFNIIVFYVLFCANKISIVVFKIYFVVTSVMMTFVFVVIK